MCACQVFGMGEKRGQPFVSSTCIEDASPQNKDCPVPGTLQGPISLSLKTQTLHASTWTATEYLFSQGLRFISNLILTRLIVPDIFGVMQIVFAFMAGLEMFSDLGVNVNIIQHPESEKPTFRRTAWTLQVLRGLVLWGGSILLAWPVAQIYQYPSLALLFPVAGLNAIISGCCSTNMALLQRHLRQKPIVQINLASQIISTALMLVLAFFFHNAWALIVGYLFGSLIKTTLSHFVESDCHMGWCLNRDVIREIVNFGRWIVLSSILTFCISQLDRILLGLYFTKTQLGLYGIAVALATALVALMHSLANNILLPLYTQLLQKNAGIQRNQIARVKTVLIIGCLIPLYALILWGGHLITFLYPPSYQDAGWMLQILAVGACISCVSIMTSPVLLAAGNSRRLTWVLSCHAVFEITFIILGSLFLGTKGLVLGLVLAEFLTYPVLVFFIRPYQVWLPVLDISVFIVTAAVTLIAKGSVL